MKQSLGGDARLGQCGGDTTNEEMVTETWLISRECDGIVEVLRTGQEICYQTVGNVHTGAQSRRMRRKCKDMLAEIVFFFFFYSNLLQ